MATPQAGIFAADRRYHFYLEYRSREGTTPAALTAALARALRNVSRATPVVAFGPETWRALAPEHTPADLARFEPVGTPERHAPATQRDLWIWLHADAHDANLAAALEINRRLQLVAEAALELPAFTYGASRDLIGFEDGTANPKGDAAHSAALVADSVPGAGGSIVLTQRWCHDLPAFEALAIGEQERIVGRTKTENIELEGDAMPPDSHISRTDVELDGEAMKIWRRSAPYGTPAENGLYFVAFACERRRIQIQLERMYGVSGDGLYDRLTDFSRAVTGSYWFAPSAEALAGALEDS